MTGLLEGEEYGSLAEKKLANGLSSREVDSATVGGFYAL